MSNSRYHVRKSNNQRGNRYDNIRKTQMEMRRATEEYLSGNRKEVIGKLSATLHQENLNRVRLVLKKNIFDYVKYYHHDFEGSIKVTKPIYEMFANFNLTDFLERTWQYRPYYLKESDYIKLQTLPKNPIHITNYDYAQPLYKLANSIEYKPPKYKLHTKLDRVKNDVQVYLSKDEDVVCAKLVNLRYRPADLKAVNQHNIDKSEEEIEHAVYDDYLYHRSLSISMYVLLDGDPRKALPYIRYDNDPVPHTNVFIGNDKRKSIFKAVALTPHFHFQNEDDSLLCLRKFKDENGKTQYKTGRCNAIDCPSLKQYLLDLDSLSQAEIAKQMKEHLDYGMPFLHMKAQGKKVGVSPDGIFKNFIKAKTEEERELLRDIEYWLNESKDDKVYNRGRTFDKFIRTLDFLDIISKLMASSVTRKVNYEQRKLYSQLEIVTADIMVNIISNNSNKYVLEDQLPKYTIETDLLEREDD